MRRMGRRSTFTLIHAIVLVVLVLNTILTSSPYRLAAAGQPLLSSLEGKSSLLSHNSLRAEQRTGPESEFAGNDVAARQSSIPVDQYGISSPTGGSPTGVVFDPANNNVYVCNYGSSNITVLNDTTDESTAASLSTGSNPQGIALDPANDTIWVSNYQVSTMTVIDAQSNSVVIPSLSTLSGPWGVTYDPENGEIYVADSASHSLTAFNATNYSVITSTIIVGHRPTYIAYDNLSGYLYVTNGDDNNVSIVNTSSNQAIGTGIRVGTNPQGIAYDPADNLIFVANEGSNNVSEIDPATNKVVRSINVSSEPYAMIYNSIDRNIYVTNFGSRNVSVIHAPSGKLLPTQIRSGRQPDALAVDARNGNIYVANWGDNNVTVTGPLIEVSLLGTGLPGGTPWYIYLNGQYVLAFGNDMGLELPNGSFRYVVGAPWHYLVSPLGGLINVSGTSISNNLTFSYWWNVWFNETGLPLGTSWTVNVSGGLATSTSSSIPFDLPNGSYSYFVAGIGNLTPSSQSGSIRVSSTDQTFFVQFSPPELFQIQFNETGLPFGSIWRVNLSGTLHSTSQNGTSYTEPNGSYTFLVYSNPGWLPSPSDGFLNISGAAAYVTIVWSAQTFSILWTEEGLPAGTEWWVNLSDGPSIGSTSKSASVDEPNGSYSFRIASSNKSWEGAGGTLHVSGANIDLAVTFYRVNYSAIFTQTGLGVGLLWAVELGRSQYNSTTLNVTVAGLSNGTYLFQVTGPSGFAPVPTSGSVRVSGGDVKVAVTFDMVTNHGVSVGAPNSTQPAPPLITLGVVGGVAVAAAAVAVLLWTRRRRGRPTNLNAAATDSPEPFE